MTIGLLYICTGKYSLFWKDFYLSAIQFLFPGTTKKFFVFTDSQALYGEEVDANIIKIKIEHREWPFNTLLRFDMFDKHRDLFAGCDYLFFYNANTLFLDKISLEELLPTEKDGWLVALCCKDKKRYQKKPDKYTYDRNPNSLAYIPFGQGTNYYRGGFNGGRTPEFLNLIQTCKEWVNTDLESNTIALWHDESHLNKYLLDKPVKMVTSIYGKAEEWKTPRDAKVIFRDKKGIFDTFKGRKKAFSLSQCIRKLLKSLLIPFRIH
jgi:hypothetical protein